MERKEQPEVRRMAAYRRRRRMGVQMDQIPNEIPPWKWFSIAANPDYAAGEGGVNWSILTGDIKSYKGSNGIL